MTLRPFIIISPGRSGSSYTAGQFVKAGVFGGRMRAGDKCNPDGYFENIALHKALREKYGSKWMDGGFPHEQPGWHEFVRDVLVSEGYSGGPWMFKCGAFYWRVFRSFDPVYVKVWRDKNKILKSFRKTKMLSSRYSEKEIEIIVDRQHEAMKSILGMDVHI